MITERSKETSDGTVVNCNCPEFTADVLIDRRNERVRVLSYRAEDLRALGYYLDKLARVHRCGKVIIYAWNTDWREMLSSGYRLEGVMSGYFMGEPAFCMSRFSDLNRANDMQIIDEDLILQRLFESRQTGLRKKVDSKFNIRYASLDDIDELSKVFSSIFSTYPSPVEDKNYLQSLIVKDGYIIMVAEFSGEIAGIVSADIDYDNMCAEVTDCAVKPTHRGQGLMGLLLDSMELELTNRGVSYVYSLARAGIPQINAVLYSSGYLFTGKLINNCNICGRYENMSIWEKFI